MTKVLVATEKAEIAAALREIEQHFEYYLPSVKSKKFSDGDVEKPHDVVLKLVISPPEKVALKNMHQIKYLPTLLRHSRKSLEIVQSIVDIVLNKYLCSDE